MLSTESTAFLLDGKEYIIGFAETKDKLLNGISEFVPEPYKVVYAKEVIDPNLPLIEKAQKLVEMGKISVSGEVSYDAVSDTYDVPVEWGDWKQDHARLNLLFREVLGLYMISETVTESDDSDTYSAIHKFTLYC